MRHITRQFRWIKILSAILNFVISTVYVTSNCMRRNTRAYPKSWTGPWTLDSGLWTLDSGLWTLDSGLWTLDSGLFPLKTLSPPKNLYISPKKTSLPQIKNSTKWDFFPNKQVRSVLVFKQTTLFPPPTSPKNLCDSP